MPSNYMILLKKREIIDLLTWPATEFPALKMFKLQQSDSIMSF